VEGSGVGVIDKLVRYCSGVPPSEFRKSRVMRNSMSWLPGVLVVKVASYVPWRVCSALIWPRLWEKMVEPSTSMLNVPASNSLSHKGWGDAYNEV
jgi:hypothetical protein